MAGGVNGLRYIGETAQHQNRPAMAGLLLVDRRRRLTTSRSLLRHLGTILDESAVALRPRGRKGGSLWREPGRFCSSRAAAPVCMTAGTTNCPTALDGSSGPLTRCATRACPTRKTRTTPAGAQRSAREIAALDDGAVLAGHSVGGAILINTLGERPPQRQLSLIVLIAAPFVGAGGWPSDEFELPHRPWRAAAPRRPGTRFPWTPGRNRPAVARRPVRQRRSRKHSCTDCPAAIINLAMT